MMQSIVGRMGRVRRRRMMNTNDRGCLIIIQGSGRSISG
jgi:hypothetical protein